MNGTRSVQTFMNNRVTDITNARDDGDSAGIVVGAAVSRPFTSLDPNVYSVIYETKIGWINGLVGNLCYIQKTLMNKHILL